MHACFLCFCLCCQSHHLIVISCDFMHPSYIKLEDSTPGTVSARDKRLYRRTYVLPQHAINGYINIQRQHRTRVDNRHASPRAIFGDKRTTRERGLFRLGIFCSDINRQRVQNLIEINKPLAVPEQKQDLFAAKYMYMYQENVD